MQILFSPIAIQPRKQCEKACQVRYIAPDRSDTIKVRFGQKSGLEELSDEFLMDTARQAIAEFFNLPVPERKPVDQIALIRAAAMYHAGLVCGTVPKGRTVLDINPKDRRPYSDKLREAETLYLAELKYGIRQKLIQETEKINQQAYNLIQDLIQTKIEQGNPTKILRMPNDSEIQAARNLILFGPTTAKWNYRAFLPQQILEEYNKRLAFDTEQREPDL